MTGRYFFALNPQTLQSLRTLQESQHIAGFLGFALFAVENRAHVTGAFELKEAGVGSQRQGAIEELTCLFTGGARGDDRAEESGAVNGNQRNTHIGAAHGLQCQVQGGAHVLIVLIGEGDIRQRCGQVDLLQRLDDCVTVGISLVAVVVNLLAQSVIEGLMTSLPCSSRTAVMRRVGAQDWSIIAW